MERETRLLGRFICCTENSVPDNNMKTRFILVFVKDDDGGNEPLKNFALFKSRTRVHVCVPMCCVSVYENQNKKTSQRKTNFAARLNYLRAYVRNAGGTRVGYIYTRTFVYERGSCCCCSRS